MLVMGVDSEGDELANFMQEIQKGRIYQENPYAHAEMLLDSEKEELGGITAKFSSIVDKDIKLGRISNDELMRYCQKDADYLTNFLSMALREPALKIVFQVLYNSWRNEFILTRAKGGSERDLQSNVMGGLAPGGAEGFGGSLKREDEVEEENFINKIMNRLRRQRTDDA